MPVLNGMMGVMADPVALGSAGVASSGSFACLVAAEQRRIFLLCNRMLQDRDEADSAAQDVFLKAYRALRSNAVEIDEPAKWLTRIAVNTCLDKLRSRRWQFWRSRPEPRDEDLILAMTASGEPSSEDFLFAKQVHLRLSKAMDRLSGRQRAVFTLKHYDDHSLEEIAEILHLEIGTVKAHMSRAVAKLREELQDVYAMSRQRSSQRGAQ